MRSRRLAVVVVGVFVSACSGGAAPSSAPTSPTSSVSPADEAVTSPTEATVPATEEDRTESAASGPSVTTTSFPPIYGYGDFSAFSYGQVPWDEVTTLELACLRDHGVSVEQSGPTGILYTGTEEQSYLWMAYFDACRAGLNIPDESTTTSADIAWVYDFWLDQAECLRGLGYSVPDPPSRESFVENYPVVDWVPYRFVPNGEIPQAEKTCPQDPYGG